MWKCSAYLYAGTLLLHALCDLSDGYKKIRLQDYLCADKLLLAIQKPFRGDPAFTLTEDRDSAAIISQLWNKTVGGHSSNSRIRYDCVFRVHTMEKPPHGIYTVITKLKFRRDPSTNSCIDYIQFLNANRGPSDRICDDISIDGPANRFHFEDRDSDVNVYIHVDRHQRILDPLELKMVLTAHSECRYNGDYQCDPKNPYSCISRYFVRDNITNCMFPCKDEGSCLNDVSAEEIDTTNVAISAITSLISTMLGVGFCVWVCWKYWNCITVQQHAHEESAAHRRSTQMDAPTIELPTCPDVEEIVVEQQPQTPKDMPPSYESLFPDR